MRLFPWMILCLLIGSLLVTSAGCGSKARRRAKGGAGCPCPDGGPPAKVDASVSLRPKQDAGAKPVRLQPFSLAGAVKLFNDHARCVRRVHASLPPELTREADRANLAERICDARRALAEKSVSLCDEINDPVWPLACRRLFAGLYGKPEACPARYPRHHGREEACVALAARDPALCRAIRSAAGAARCRAILGPDSACRALRTTAEVASCGRDRRRWRTVLRPAKPSLPERFAPRFELMLITRQKTLRGGSAALNHGVVVPAASPQGRFVLDALLPPAKATPFSRKVRLALDLPVPTEIPASLSVGGKRSGVRLCALWDERPVRPDQIKGKLELRQFGQTRGARLAGRFNVTLRIGDQVATLRGKFDTFVRDVVRPGWIDGDCRARLAEVVPTPKATAGTPTQPTPAEGQPCYFVAHWEGLNQVGYRVYGIKPRQSCARLGLRTNDVVTAVDGRPMRRWADVQHLYKRLAEADRLEVAVRRKRRRLTLKRSVRRRPGMR
jgi:hypothetical protein